MRKTQIVAASVIATLLVTGCGGSKDGSGGDHRAPRGEETSETQEGYNYEFTGMSELNSAYTETFGEEPNWSVRVSVNGEERTSVEKVSFVDLKNSLSSLAFQHYDLVRTEITVLNKESETLATNLKEVAYKSENLKKVWDVECSYFGEPEQEVSEVDFQFVDGENKLRMDVQICDFAGFTMKPIMQIVPQKKNIEKKLAIYHCEFSPDSVSTSDTSPYIEKYVGDTPCSYEYETLPGETAPKIEILKEFAPGTSLYNAKLLRFDSVKLKVGNAGQFLLDTDFHNPPFGSLTACHTIKLDVKYGTDSGVGMRRLEFKRAAQDGGVTWMPQDSDSWPAVKEIAKYYKESENEKMHLYRFCDWIPEGKDLKAGNVISISI